MRRGLGESKANLIRLVRTMNCSMLVASDWNIWDINGFISNNVVSLVIKNIPHGLHLYSYSIVLENMS